MVHRFGDNNRKLLGVGFDPSEIMHDFNTTGVKLTVILLFY